MKVKFHGHSVVSLETDAGTKILIDSFITGNPTTDLVADTVTPDVILLTHAHDDHLGDTVDIAKRTGALVVATFELCAYLNTKGIENFHPMQPGGAHQFDFAKIHQVQAIHGSSVLENGQSIGLGLATGFIIEADGQTVYHLGDTALFSDLKMIGDLFAIDLAFIPIGDNYTMGPDHAVLAAEWLQAKRVVPIHYNTEAFIEQDADDYISRLEPNVGIIPEIGQEIPF